MSKTFLVTGAAGFVGSHVAQLLLERHDRVVGLDNLNDYYNPARKRSNLAEIEQAIPDRAKFHFVEGDFRDRELVDRLFAEYEFEAVIHLGAMAGVRASIEDPFLYYDVNVNGSMVLLETVVGRSKSGRKGAKMPNFVFASTSSAYGTTEQIPFVETDPSNTPLAPYSASKRAVELLGHSYHHLYKLNFTALRFFNVYGPRGRPDMMPFKLLDNIFFGRVVPLYNQGQMYRDWTFVEDIAKGVVAAADRPLGYEVINLGRGEPVLMADFVRLVETVTNRKVSLPDAPAPETEMYYTYADTSKAARLLGYAPVVSVEEGVRRFWDWYQQAVLAPQALTQPA